MKRILCTGGAGFIGSHLIDRLLLEEYHVTTFDNFDSYYNPVMKFNNVQHHIRNVNFRLLSGNVTDCHALERAFTVSKPDAVIHLAAQAGVRPSIQNPQLHCSVNIEGTVNVLELCRKYDVKKVIYLSSSSVYGNHPVLPFTETQNVSEPLCPYAATKKAGELLCYTYHHLYDMDIDCARPFTVYGSRQRTEMAIPLFTRLLYNEQPVTVYGDGSTMRDYTHVFDVVDGIVRMLRFSVGYQIYNLASSSPISLIELIKNINLLLGKDSHNIKINCQPMGIGEACATYGDITKARSKLGYAPCMTIYTGLQEYIGWYLKEGQYNAV
jgi:UDP-glucuronate 4-epimerase